MRSTELQRAINEFRRSYEANVSLGTMELRLSQLSEKRQADWRKRDGELHPSSFPFCGLRSAYERYTREADPKIRSDFGSDYYLPAGTVFHSSVQKWLGRGGQMLGNWKCRRCGAFKKFTVQPKPCRKCHQDDWEYRELGGTWGKNLHWHTDGVFRRANETNWVVDYKTTSSYAIEEHRKSKTTFPYVANRFQIETYAPMIEDNYGIDIHGWMLVYCARDSPGSLYKVEVVGGIFNEERKAEIRERLIQADKDFGVTLRVPEKPVAVFKRLHQTKLCEDRDFYNHFVYDKYNECPLQEVCFNRKKLALELSSACEKKVSFE